MNVQPTESFPIDLSAFEQMQGSGIYFLHRGGVVVYVGQALSIRKRICEHIGQATKRFDSVSFQFCHTRDLNKLEQKYIRRFAPEYNLCGTATKARRDKELAEPGLTKLVRLPRSSKRLRVPVA